MGLQRSMAPRFASVLLEHSHSECRALSTSGEQQTLRSPVSGTCRGSATSSSTGQSSSQFLWLSHRSIPWYLMSLPQTTPISPRPFMCSASNWMKPSEDATRSRGLSGRAQLRSNENGQIEVGDDVDHYAARNSAHLDLHLPCLPMKGDQAGQ